MILLKSIAGLATAAIAAAFALSAPLYAAKPVLELLPSSKWAVNYDTDRCILGRGFGADEQKINLIFETFAPGPEFRFSLAGKPVKFNDQGGDAILQFGSAEKEYKYSFQSGTLGENNPAAFFGSMQIAPLSEDQIQQRKSNPQFRLDPISTEREAAAKTISINGPFRQNLVLKTGGLAKPLSALRKCSDDLAASWGIDVAKHVNLQRYATPKKSPGTWIVSSDYPKELLNQGARSIVQFRLMVDSTGNPTSCHIQKSNRLKDFDDTVCRNLMKRARFDSALAEDGTPIASYYVNTVFFEIEP